MNRFIALLGASVLLAGPANAEGWFVGGSFGAAEASLSADTQFGDLEIDDRLFLVKGFGGYRVNKFFAVEGSLIGASNNDFDDGFDNDLEATFAALTGSFVGFIPVDDSFEFFAKIGGYLGESDVGDDFSIWGSGNEQNESGLLWGAGFRINFGSRDRFTIRFDYEEFDTDAFDDLWAVSGGFQYTFK